ncbi:MAG: hypothetical protein JW839_16965 [Candidatus Lokiarchaeota archaeon]|nr:hypothetical protein [Candidatus Lokiarchaeota archaeon]
MNAESVSCHFYEHVFPHCIHPRVEQLIEIAWYIEDHYGTAMDGPRYPRVFREILLAEGGIDTRALEITLQAVAGSEDEPCHCHVPAWLDAKLGAHSTREDLVEGARSMGGFEPYKEITK